MCVTVHLGANSPRVTVHLQPPAARIPSRPCAVSWSELCGELEGREARPLRARTRAGGGRRGDFTVDPPPPAAELCSSRAVAIGVREEFQQLVSEPVRFCGDVITPGALGDSTTSMFARSISTEEANA